MAVYIAAIVYCLALIAGIVALQRKLLWSEKEYIRAAAWIVSALVIGSFYW